MRSGVQAVADRFYDPATGQFLTRDPAVSSTRSAYGYTYGNPLNAIDPSGLMCWNVTDTDCVKHLADNVVPDDMSSAGDVARPVINTMDGADLAGVMWAGVTGGNCSFRGSHVECTDVKWLPRDVMTIGDVVLEDSESPISENDPVLWSHETNHSNQWAFWGWAFVPAYFGDLAIHHGSGCGGWFEQAANGPAGGYDDCTCDD